MYETKLLKQLYALLDMNKFSTEISSQMDFSH